MDQFRRKKYKEYLALLVGNVYMTVEDMLKDCAYIFRIFRSSNITIYEKVE